MADPTPPGPPTTWSGWLYLLLVILFGWIGDWLRSRWQNRTPPPTPHNHPHRRHDDVCEECEHHHHRASDEDEEG